MKKSFPRMGFFSAIAVLVVLLDQLTKKLVSSSMALGESVPFLPGFIEFRYILNRGAAWGMFSERRWVFLLVTAIALVVLPVFLWLNRHLPLLFGISLSMIIGGAVGNMIDRVFTGAVVDFIATEFIDFPVFNVADCAIVVGGFLMLFYFLFIDKEFFRDSKKEAKEKDASGNDTESNEKN